jgi:hypothetical protein
VTPLTKTLGRRGAFERKPSGAMRREGLPDRSVELVLGLQRCFVDVDTRHLPKAVVGVAIDAQVASRLSGEW